MTNDILNSWMERGMKLWSFMGRDLLQHNAYNVSANCCFLDLVGYKIICQPYATLMIT